MREHLATLLDDFRRHGSQIAVVRHRGNRRRAASYGEIARLAGRFAALLEARGIGLGDRVLLWAENSAEWIAAFYGCMLRGVLVVPLDAYGSADFAARVAADVRPMLAVGDEKLLLQLPAAQLDFPRLAFELWLDSLPLAETDSVPGLSHGTPLQILFTSGTTGDPKGVVLTHGNVLASVEPIERGAQPYLRYERIVHPLRFLHTLPLSHVFGQTMGLWIPPIFAAEVHFEDRLVASRLIETIRRERISVLAAVPRIHGLLKTHLETAYPGLADEIAAAHGMRAWKKWIRFRRIHRAFGFKFWALISGGGALSAPLEEFWNGLAFVVIQGYGMTETTALITLNHPFRVTRGSIGKPLPGREVKLGADGEVLVRGPMISTATWTGGAIQTRPDEWLATGDLAEAQDAGDLRGDLRFLGRKSETIVTSAGVNLHPEDLEAVLERQAGVTACAVVAMETVNGPEPCAVLAMRGRPAQSETEQAAQAIERANLELAEFQRLRRWVLWPDPDLPRTSTGKVRRRAVAEWVKARQAATADQLASANHAPTGLATASDWLLALIGQISGEVPRGIGDELLLSEDLHLDSLGRVQLGAALEERTGFHVSDGALDRVRTLGELRSLLTGARSAERATELKGRVSARAAEGNRDNRIGPLGDDANSPVPAHASFQPYPSEESTYEQGAAAQAGSSYIYPRWPWLAPIRWLRTAFLEAVVRPLVWLLANPCIVGPSRVASPATLASPEPLLIVCNHVTAFDGPLVEYALPGHLRRRIAAAMSGEMLEDYRHFRNPGAAAKGPKPAQGRFMLFGPLTWLLLTALFNVFPLPRRRGFERSFAHAGQAMDRGFHVLVFPEGTRSARGELAPFRPGIGLLVRQTGARVLPVAIRGLGELKASGRGWFRSGKIEVHIGEPIRFSAADSEASIAEKLHRAVAALLTGEEGDPSL
jgi:long-chain acyl-CoA synthetase